MVNRMNRTSMFSPSCTAMNNTVNNTAGASSKAALLKKLQKVDFSIIDIVLYLDAYPNCKKALDYYHKLIAERKNLLEKLNEMGVVINNMSNTADTWDWCKSPWPWEYEAN